MDSALEKIAASGLIPVVKIDDPEQAVPLARALAKGGLRCIEITFRTTAAAAAIEAIRREVPEMLVGAGTVINTELARIASDAGASFIVAPGFNPAVVEWCLEREIPVIPGVSGTAGIEQALEMGIKTLKFFPAEVSGGTAMLDALAGPYPQLTFIPTGGIDLANMPSYLAKKNVLAVGGSWLSPKNLLESGGWDAIEALAREAVTAVHGFELAHIGINQDNPEAASATANLFSSFGFSPKEGNSSIFCGTSIEVMKQPFRGEMGHIAFRCRSIERALAYLETKGFTGVQETAKSDNGTLSVIYLDPEIGGFAVHLLRSR